MQRKLKVRKACHSSHVHIRSEFTLCPHSCGSSVTLDCLLCGTFPPFAADARFLPHLRGSRPVGRRADLRCALYRCLLSGNPGLACADLIDRFQIAETIAVFVQTP